MVVQYIISSLCQWGLGIPGLCVFIVVLAWGSGQRRVVQSKKVLNVPLVLLSSVGVIWFLCDPHVALRWPFFGSSLVLLCLLCGSCLILLWLLVCVSYLAIMLLFLWLFCGSLSAVDSPLSTPRLVWPALVWLFFGSSLSLVWLLLGDGLAFMFGSCVDLLWICTG